MTVGFDYEVTAGLHFGERQKNAGGVVEGGGVWGRLLGEKGEVNTMSEWTESEMFLYGGIAVMGAVCVLAAVCAVVFTLTGRKLKKKLEQE